MSHMFSVRGQGSIRETDRTPDESDGAANEQLQMEITSSVGKRRDDAEDPEDIARILNTSSKSGTLNGVHTQAIKRKKGSKSAGINKKSKHQDAELGPEDSVEEVADAEKKLARQLALQREAEAKDNLRRRRERAALVNSQINRQREVLGNAQQLKEATYEVDQCGEPFERLSLFKVAHREEARPREWQDVETRTLIKALKEFDGDNRYMQILIHYGGEGQPLSTRGFDDIVSKAREIKVDIERDLEMHPGTGVRMPRWLRSV